jgi:hypothetical protein
MGKWFTESSAASLPTAWLFAGTVDEIRDPESRRSCFTPAVRATWHLAGGADADPFFRRRMLTSRGLLPLLVLCVVPAIASVPAEAQDIVTDPAQVRLEVDDIRRFAEVVRLLDAGDVADTVGLIEREYLGTGSPGLRAYAGRFEVTGGSIASAMAARPGWYADLDGLADLILSKEPELRSAFHGLQELFPGAAFPPVWFVVGGHGPRGQAALEGALIGSEGSGDRPDDIVPLVVHELAHFQSAMVQGVETYGRIYGPDRTLLALALREGSAELIAELVTGRHTNPAAEPYGLANEERLWTHFQLEMNGPESGDWMWVRPANPDWPPNLGYWMGYRIVESYYHRAEDKEAAILEILRLTDFEDFLEASGYGEHFGKQTIRK